MRTSNWIFILLIGIGMFTQSCSEDSLLSGTQVSSFETESNINSVADLRAGDHQNSKSGTPVNKIGAETMQSWTSLILDLDRYCSGMRPNATARAIAYIYLSGYETAVPGMREYTSTSRQLDGLRGLRPERNHRIQYELALNTALGLAVDHFLFTLSDENKAKIALLQDENEEALIVGLSDKEVEESKEWGTKVAEAIISYSQSDAAAEEQILDPQPVSYVPPTGDGYWTFSADPERALFPYWGNVRTFAIAPEETTTIAPLEYSTSPGTPYFEQMQEVYTVNNDARTEQGEQLHIAEFWSDDVEGLMMSPPMRQVSILAQLIEQEGLNLEDALVLHLKLGFSLNDAAVSTWKYKYDYMVMRPSNFIREFIDADFQTNLYRLVYWPNPSFPGYPSGHSCFASAAAGVFIEEFGNTFTFTDRTHEGRTEFLGEPRTFETFEAMADENGYSRIPLGVHVRMDCTEGLRLGYEIADAVNDFDIKRRRQ